MVQRLSFATATFTLLALLSGCTSSVVGTGAVVDDVQPAKAAPPTTEQEDLPVLPEAPVVAPAKVTLSVDGVPHPTLKDGGAWVARDGSLALTLQRKDATENDPRVLLSIGHPGEGCTWFGTNGVQSVTWRPEGHNSDGAHYESAKGDETCGLVVSRADTTAGGRVKGTYYGFAKLEFGGRADSPDEVYIQLSFDVPVVR